MQVSNSTAGPVSTNDNDSGYAPLTREKLFLLNLENTTKKQQLSRQLVSAPPTTQVNNENYTVGFNSLYAQAPGLSNSSSSSSSSLNSTSSSVLEGEEGNFYNYYNGSDSSIATIVQKLSSSNSDSTIDLANVDSKTPAIEHHENITVDDDDVTSVTSTSSIERHDYDDDDDQSRMSIPRSLKSSLKLPSLTRSKSLPSTKTVRFSAELEKVKTFNEYAKPSSISLENSPDQSPPLSSYSTGHAYFDLKHADFSSPWYDQSSDDSNDEEDYYYKKPSINTETKWKLKSMNFDLFRQSDPSVFVKLISLNTSKESIVGVVQVLNISFEKSVEVKFTVDNWNSIYIVNATYDHLVDSKIDQFKFEINLNNSLMINFKKSKNQPINIELCVKYSSNHETFYDNNSSSNFKFQLVSNKKSSSSQRSRRHSPSNRLSDNLLINSSNSYADYNFAVTSPSPSPTDYPTNENYTTSRYFPDDTDYFNTKVFKSTPDSSPYSWNYASHGSISSASTISSISSKSTISTSSTSSNETIKASTSSNQGSNPKDLTSTNAESLQKSRQHYNEFLKKYCYFKSNDQKNDFNESLFIR